jgi:hypothetical protein
MASPDPFATLGLRAGASADEIQGARRRLAKQHHPDHGGDAGHMQTINEAADAALLVVGRPPAPTQQSTQQSDDTEGAGDQRSSSIDRGFSGVSRDVPSFTVEALPVETFEAMLVVASWLGEVLDDDPPYRLDTYLQEPFDCWCRLDVVPDAGASTVSLSIAGIDGASTPDIVAVRDAWVANLNAVDWA